MMYNQKNTTQDHLIAFLLSARSTKIYRRVLWERAKDRQKSLSYGAFNQQIYRLHKKGILQPKDEVLKLSRHKLLKYSLKRYLPPLTGLPEGGNKVLISFDIPEAKKKTRDWLRNQLKRWEFELIHKSLWLGPGSLPKEFGQRLKDLDIFENVRMFRVRKLA